ncbi:MAG: peptidase [Paenibacillus sp.]|nr:peptidase [Paenibacillus sp.]
MLSEWLQLDSLLYRVIALMIAILLHDVTQSLVALLLGDRTAKEAGRLTLNPAPHLSAIGVLACLFGPFCWSKPVPVALAQLKGKPKLSALVVYASGMLISLIVGIVMWGLFFTDGFESIDHTFPGWASEFILGVVKWTYLFNLMLFIMHLVPVYPTDLWKGLRLVLPARWEPRLALYEKVGPYVLLAIVISPIGQRLLNSCYEQLTSIIMNMYSVVSG